MDLHRYCFTSFAVLLALVVQATFANQSGAAKLTAADFSRLPAFSSPQISPDGKYVAAFARIKGVPAIVTTAVSGQGKPYVIPIGEKKFYEGFYYEEHRWVADDRLAVTIRRSGIVSRADRRTIRRIVITGIDGSNPQFPRMERDWTGAFRWYPYVVDTLASDPEHIIMALDNQDLAAESNWIWYAPKLHKVNVYTGERDIFDENRLRHQHFILNDAGEYTLGIKYTNRRTVYASDLLHRPSPSDEWRVTTRYENLALDVYEPFAFLPGSKNVVLRSRRDYRDHWWDTDSNIDYAIRHGESIQLYDLSDQKVVGTYSSRLHDSIARALEKADRSLRFKVLSVSRDRQLATVSVYSDQIPHRFYIFNAAKNQLKPIAHAYPGFKAQAFAGMEATEYEARDGLAIPVLLTRPFQANSDEKPPAVILPRSRPWSRDYLEYTRMVQFLAQQGYLVVQPQFRGATGFGDAHHEAGSGQWGLGMNDDIEDAASWLANQELADPERICVVGEGFGGYVAAHSLIRRPGFFRCAVSINGIMDLPEYTRWANKVNFTARIKRIADNQRALSAVSPLQLADAVTAPLLLIAGELNSEVHVKHSRRMYKKLRSLKKEVKYIELERGEHWPGIQEHETIKYDAIAAFLKTQLH